LPPRKSNRTDPLILPEPGGYGGYTQWEEFAFEDTPANPPSPIHTELMDFICCSTLPLGLVLNVHCRSNRPLEEIGFEKVYREERNSYWYPELVSET